MLINIISNFHFKYCLAVDLVPNYLQNANIVNTISEYLKLQDQAKHTRHI
jgi:hypothetical protein